MKKIIALVTLGFALTAVSVQAQTLQWTTNTQAMTNVFVGAGIPFIQMHGSAVLDTGGKKFMYVIGGNSSVGPLANSANNDSPYMYKAEITSTRTLTAFTTCSLVLPMDPTNANIPGWCYIERSVDTYNGKIYVVGGNNNDGPPQRQTIGIMTPDTTTGDVTTITLTPVSGITSVLFEACIIDKSTGRLYVIGGGSGAASRTTRCAWAQIDGSGNVGAFTATSALPSARGQHSVVIKNGYMYSVAGNPGTPDAVIYYAKINGDGSLGTWATASATLPEARFDSGAVADPRAGQNFLYYVGGAVSGNTTIRNTVFKIQVDPATGNATAAFLDSNIPTGPRAGYRRSMPITDGRTIYMTGGRMENLLTYPWTELYQADFPQILAPSTSAKDWQMYH